MVAGVLSGFAMVSCDDDNEPDTTITVDMSNANVNYDAKSVWDGCLESDKTGFVCQDVYFSHQATESEWGNYWYGFCPSRSSDTQDYSDTESGFYGIHEWDVMSGGGLSGEGTPFVVAYWNSSEGATPGDNASLLVKHLNGVSFYAESVYVNNTTLTYYTILNGNAFSRPFAEGDWFKVQFFGVTASDAVVGPVEYYLADFRSENSEEWSMTDEWTLVDLSALTASEPVKYIYMQMASSDSGQFGMNTPGYFAIDRLKIRL